MAVSMNTVHSEVYLLCHWLIHRFEVYLFWCRLIIRPQTLQSYTCCVMDLSTAKVTSRCTCSGTDFPIYHNPFRGPFRCLQYHGLIHRHRTLWGILAWISPQTWTLQSVPAVAWTSFWQLMLKGVLCFTGDLSIARDSLGCTLSYTNSSTGHSASDSSSVWSSILPSTEAQRECQCHGCWPVHVDAHNFYQYVPRHSKTRW